MSLKRLQSSISVPASGTDEAGKYSVTEYQSGSWYQDRYFCRDENSSGLIAPSIPQIMPFEVDFDVEISAFAFQFPSTAGLTNLFQYGVYKMGTSSQRLGERVAFFDRSGATYPSGVNTFFNSPFAIERGRYTFAIQNQVSMMGYRVTTNASNQSLGQELIRLSGNTHGYRVGGTLADLQEGTLVTSGVSTSVPIWWWRAR